MRPENTPVHLAPLQEAGTSKQREEGEEEEEKDERAGGIRAETRRRMGQGGDKGSRWETEGDAIWA